MDTQKLLTKLAILTIIIAVTSCLSDERKIKSGSGNPEINIKLGETNVPSGGSHDFGDVLVATTSASVTYTIENLGDGDLTLSASPFVSLSGDNTDQFNLTQPSSSTIEPGKDTTFTIAFSPTSAQLKTAALTIINNDSDEGNFTISLIGTGVLEGTPEIDILQGADSIALGGSYNFGNIVFGKSSPATVFTIKNTGSAVLDLTNSPYINLSGTHTSMFILEQPSLGTIDAGGSATFTITFIPTSLGLKDASILINNSDSDEGSYTITLLGTGVASQAEIDLLVDGNPLLTGEWYDFGSVVHNTSGLPVIFTIENNGTGDLILNGSPAVNLTGADSIQFSVSQPAETLISAGNSTTFSITFEPQLNFIVPVSGVQAIISNNDSDEGTFTFNLAAEGTLNPESYIIIEQAGNVIQNTDTFDFGVVVEGTAGPTFTFIIKNSGTADLTLDGAPLPLVNVTGADPAEFSVDIQPPPTPIAPGNNSTFDMTFNPDTSGVGPRSATISIPNNSTNAGSFTINLTGTARFPDCVLGDALAGQLGACQLASL
jgi:hypothetical protein